MVYPLFIQAAHSLDGMIKLCKDKIPENKHNSTPLILKATAGLRLLPGDKADNILNEVELFTIGHNLILSQTSPCFYRSCFYRKSFENTVGKREIARTEQFILFPHCFLPCWRTLYYFHRILKCGLQTLSVWKSL